MGSARDGFYLGIMGGRYSTVHACALLCIISVYWDSRDQPPKCVWTYMHDHGPYLLVGGVLAQYRVIRRLCQLPGTTY